MSEGASDSQVWTLPFFHAVLKKSAFLPPVSKPSEIRTPGKVQEVRLVKGFDIVWEVAAAGAVGTLTLAKI